MTSSQLVSDTLSSAAHVTNATGLFRLLYVSDIAVADLTPLVEIAAQSRPWNRERNITGLLLFDGQHFAQFIEGPESGVAELLLRLQRDRRHKNMTILWYGPCEPDRRFPTWQMAFGAGDEHLGLANLRGFRRDAAVRDFLRIATGLSPEF